MKAVQFENTLEDLRAYYHYWAFSTSEGKRWVRRILIFGQIIYLIGALLIWGFSNNIRIALGIWFLFELGWLIRAGFRPGGWLAQRTIENWLKPMTGNELENYSLPKVFEYSDTQVSVRTQEETHAVSWKRVKRIGKTNTDIFIHYGMRTIWVIPRRAFASDDEFDETYEDLCNTFGNRAEAEFPKAGDILVD